MINNDVIEIICVAFRSNIHFILWGFVISGIFDAFSAARNLKQEIKLNRALEEDTSLLAICDHMRRFTQSVAPIFLIYLALFHPGGNLSNTAESTPDSNATSQTQSQSETLKVGDEIIVASAPSGLKKWDDAYRKIRCKELTKYGNIKKSAKNGDVGEILVTKIHNGYTMHYVEWCNGEMNWVAEKDPKDKVYLKKR